MQAKKRAVMPHSFRVTVFSRLDREDRRRGKSWKELTSHWEERSRVSEPSRSRW